MRCQGVTKKFGALAAVDDLNFTVKEGEVLGVGGPNGAGKTALFDAISGVNPSTSGVIEFDEVRIERMPPDQVCSIGLSRTFQLNSGFDSLTVLENLMISCYFGASKRKIPGAFFDAKTRDEVTETMEFVGLADFAHEEVRNLPVYQRKLLMIGSAMSRKPKLLMLDEPVGGLNPSEIDKILELVERISARSVTVMLIEHVMRFLMHLSDRVLILNRGRRLFEGLPSDVLSDRNVVEVYLGERSANALRSQMST